ncbi:MAG: N-acetyltransferase [Kiritimatiellaeota bacterium]|nr:N-acetyltransferase [Kiritimatiellota bacterium]
MLVSEVVTPKDRERFIRFPWGVYRKDPCWVPPLIAEVRAFLDPQKNPFFEHADVQLFTVAHESGALCGRIAAVVNRRHNELHGERTGFFGMFECVNDPRAAAALFDAAANFFRARGLTIMRGPENLSVNDDIGLLIEGFDTPPTIMMPYNPPYYSGLIEACGFRKAMDLYAYYGDTRELPIPERIVRGMELCRRRYKFTVRPVDLRRFDEEIDKIYKVYTEAWEQNWGAVAMTRKEFDHLAAQLKSALDPDLMLIAEVGGEVAGFSLALPDFNQALIKLNGRLFPFGMLKLLWHRRKINMLRVITLGTLKRFRRMGIDNYFYVETWKRAFAKGLYRSEMSWILENNTPMNNALHNLGVRLYKCYRLYDREL